MHSGFNGGDPNLEVIPEDRDLIHNICFCIQLLEMGMILMFLLDDIEDPRFTQIFITYGGG